MKRRHFFGLAAALPAALNATGMPQKKDLIKPTKLNPGDTIGLITPASPLFEPRQTMIAVKEKIRALGFRAREGKHIYKKTGYLAGSDADRVEDIHAMFLDKEIRAILAVRGGYGSGRLLKYLDYSLIAGNPKIVHGYSDITSLLLGIHKMTGLVTFHGPVAISTFTEFTRKYFMRTLTSDMPVGEIEDAPFEENLQTSNRVWTINGGTAEGRLTGGNLTLINATLGTPYEIDTRDRILFIEEVSEEPNDLDRYLTQLADAGKFEGCAAVVFDRMASVHPSSLKPGFYSNLSKEDVIMDCFAKYRFPVCLGLSLGHVADKPTLPLGIMAQLDADRGKLSLLENAVV